MNSLIQKFKFKKPVLIESTEYENEVLTLPDKIVIRINDMSPVKNYAEIISRAKLGEKDPLLSTFFFQKNINPIDEQYAIMFASLCQPLMDAWTYKIMRQYIPNVYYQEIKKLFQLYTLSVANSDLLKFGENDAQIVLCVYAILLESSLGNVDFSFYLKENNNVEWISYLSELSSLVHADPAPDLYLQLPLAAQSPFCVSIRSEPDGFRYYEIQGIANVCAIC